MKRIIVAASIAELMEQPEPIGFTPLEHQQQQASSLPVEPTSGDSLPATLEVAASIKPTETIGSLAVALLKSKPDVVVDAKVVILKPANGGPARELLFPATGVDATILGSETLIGSIVRDDASNRISAHTLTPVSGHEADDVIVGLTNILAEAKPKRAMAGLINAMSDELDAFNDGAGYSSAIAFVIDQTGDGTIKIYDAGVAGTLTGKLADVTQDASVPSVTPSEW